MHIIIILVFGECRLLFQMRCLIIYTENFVLVFVAIFAYIPDLLLFFLTTG